MRDLPDVEHRVVVLQRVIPVVIAERALGLAHLRRDLPHQRELRVRDQRMGMTAGCAGLWKPLTGYQRREHQLGHVLRKRRDRRRSEERRVGKECRSWWAPYH